MDQIEVFVNSNMKLVIASICVFFGLQAIKWLARKNIKRSEENPAEQFSMRQRLDAYVNILFFFLLFFIWFSQLQSILISLVAVAAALVLATKEIIMCFSGGILIRKDALFKRGDRIDVDGVRGFVFSRSLTSTKILEIGPDSHSQQTTGNIIVIPNSLVLSKVVKNESFFRGYSIKSFYFDLENIEELHALEDKLLEWAFEITKDNLEDARDSIMSSCIEEGISIPAIEPRVKLISSKETPGFTLLLKMPVRNSLVADVEQHLYRKYLSWLIASRKTNAPIES